MRERVRRVTMVAVVMFALVTGVVSTITTTTADDGFLPCDTVCVPIPTFPFILCAPSCPAPGPPGP